MRDLTPETSSASEQIRLTVRGLGYAGAIPFIGCALAGWQDITVAGLPADRLLLGYGAVILSFLGGLHWGRIASAPADRPPPSAPLWLVWSVIPSLVGWAALFMPAKPGAVFLSACFLLALLLDLKLIREQIWRAWMFSLRFHLTLAALAGLISMMVWI